MADYTLVDGVATEVQEDVGTQEASLDVTMDVLPLIGTLQEDDQLLVQRGFDDVKKTYISNLKSILAEVASYDTLWVPGAAMTPAMTDGADPQTIEYSLNEATHSVMDFTHIVKDTHADFDVVFPENWDGATLKAKVYWSPVGETGSTGEWVRFYISATPRDDGDVMNAALNAASNMDDQHQDYRDLHITPASGLLDLTGITDVREQIHFKLSRDYDFNGGGTAMDADAYVYGVLFQFKTNQFPVAW